MTSGEQSDIIPTEAFDKQRRDLEQLEMRHRRRKLAPRRGIDFSSNDYLGLAGSARLRDAIVRASARGVPVGSGGSRLLRGNHEEHEGLERDAAAFFGSETALYFSSGYSANAALLATLPQRGDCIFYDHLIHASAHDGMRQSRADATAAPHDDAAAMDEMIGTWRASGAGRAGGTPWIVIESLYSMDGDIAQLADYAAVAREHNAVLVIDEAHATGVFGDGGRGFAASLGNRDNIITLHTCGKAMGCEGALLCGPKVMRDHLVNRARSFIFSTAPSPLMASAACEALKILEDEPERRRRLHEIMNYAAQRFGPLGASPQGSQIIPLIVGDDAKVMQLAAQLQKEGFDVRGIRPPTVPQGTARLRIAINAELSRGDIDALAAALEAASDMQ